MDRRDFFRRSLDKAARTVVKEVDARAEARASHWIRPPFAISEIEFLLACTRCDQCIKACPHQVVFPLPARLGADVVSTPAMDLLNKGCHLCEDWPCVSACESAALTLPPLDEEGNLAIPKLAKATVDTRTCLPYQGPECGACVSVCPVKSALLLQAEKPHIDDNTCVGCGLCREACILEPKAILIQTITPPALNNTD